MKITYTNSSAQQAVYFSFVIEPESEFERNFLALIPSRNFQAYKFDCDCGGGPMKQLLLNCMKGEA